MTKSYRLPRKQLSDLHNAFEIRTKSKEPQRFSEQKPKLNLIKINKQKLPLDFFPKS